MRSVYESRGLLASPRRNLHSVVHATLAPEGETRMTLTITGKVQNHASRLCEGIKCICVGNSQMVAWVAEYKYKVEGIKGAGYRGALDDGRLFVKVEHSFENYERPSRGAEKLVGSPKVVEHWRVLSNGETEGDCIYFENPFHAAFRCGIRSVVKTMATVEVLVKGKHPDNKSWETATGTKPKSKFKTPKGALFLDATVGGEAAKATKRLEPDPVHCADWQYWMNDTATGYESKESQPAPAGEWLGKDGKPTDRDPQGESGTKDIDDPTGPGRLSSNQSLRSVSAVGTGAGLAPVTASQRALTGVVLAPTVVVGSDLPRLSRREDLSDPASDDKRGMRA